MSISNSGSIPLNLYELREEYRAFDELPAWLRKVMREDLPLDMKATDVAGLLEEWDGVAPHGAYFGRGYEGFTAFMLDEGLYWVNETRKRFRQKPLEKFTPLKPIYEEFRNLTPAERAYELSEQRALL